VALVILAIAATRLPESRDRQAHALDWPAVLLITASLTGITYGLLESPTRGFGDPAVLASLAAMSLPPELDDTQREAVRAAIAESFIVGYRAVMAIAAGLALASAGVAWLMIRPIRTDGS
jgi:hypothetical protein